MPKPRIALDDLLAAGLSLAQRCLRTESLVTVAVIVCALVADLHEAELLSASAAAIALTLGRSFVKRP